jgi:hypothetical protein
LPGEVQRKSGRPCRSSAPKRSRQLAENRNIPGVTETYMPSFSTRTVVCCSPPSQVGSFYHDLRNELDHVEIWWRVK